MSSSPTGDSAAHETAALVAAAAVELARRLPREPSRLAVSPQEAAASLGVSRDFFDEHVAPELRIVRRGRRRLVAVAELERWLTESASRSLRAEL